MESQHLDESPVKKREVKFQEKEEVVDPFDRKHYHCYLINKDTGLPCEGIRLSTKNLWRHIQSKMHFGPEYQSKAGLPYDVKECESPECLYCENKPEIQSKSLY